MARRKVVLRPSDIRRMLNMPINWHVEGFEAQLDPVILSIFVDIPGIEEAPEGAEAPIINSQETVTHIAHKEVTWRLDQ